MPAVPSDDTTSYKVKDSLNDRQPVTDYLLRLPFSTRPNDAIRTSFSIQSNGDLIKKGTYEFSPIPAQYRSENKDKLEERYEVLEAIGKGGFGLVRRIQDKSTGVCRALKTMQKAKCQDPREFSGEIKILQKLV